MNHPLNIDGPMNWPGKPCAEDALVLLPPDHASLFLYLLKYARQSVDIFTRNWNEKRLHRQDISNIICHAIAAGIDLIHWSDASALASVPRSFIEGMFNFYLRTGMPFPALDVSVISHPEPQPDWFSGVGYGRWIRGKKPLGPYIPGHSKLRRRIIRRTAL